MPVARTKENATETPPILIPTPSQREPTVRSQENHPSGLSPGSSIEKPSQRELIRSHMKMVIEQLEGILKELKDVARELQEVVGQIDRLTLDFDFDLEPDDWTVATASSTSSSERGLGESFRVDFLSHDLLSENWEFCNFLEATASASTSASNSTSTAPGTGPGSVSGSCPKQDQNRVDIGDGVTRTKSVGGRASTSVQTGEDSSDQSSCIDERRGELSPPATATVGTLTMTTIGSLSSAAKSYSQMNGSVPGVPNGPLTVITPDSSSEEASSSTQSQKTSRTSGTRERVRFSDKILYHALCCDDDEDAEEEEVYGEEEDDDIDEEDQLGDDDDKQDCGTPDTDSELSPLTCSPIPPLSSLTCAAATDHSRFQNCLDGTSMNSLPVGPSLVGRLPPGSHELGRSKGAPQPSSHKKLSLRNSSTQTVSDKSTQTVLPYVPSKQKPKEQ